MTIHFLACRALHEQLDEYVLPPFLLGMSYPKRAWYFMILSRNAELGGCAEYLIETWGPKTFAGDIDKAFLAVFNVIAMMRQTIGLPGCGHA